MTNLCKTPLQKAILALFILTIGGLAVVTTSKGPRKVIDFSKHEPVQLFNKAYHTIKFAVLPTVVVEAQESVPSQPIHATHATEFYGPLYIHPTNPRYFTDNGQRVVYLTGSHTWSNLVDNGASYPPPPFDYSAYLDFLVANNHNFFRLWSWEQSRWTVETADENYWFDPMVFLRPGPGLALDGQAKFDVTQFNQAYFERMRARIIAAGDRGIYVSIMLFDGWSIESPKGWYDQNNPWQGHPFNASNNINGLNGDPNGNQSGEEIHQLMVPEITAIQEAYVRKVIDTVNDLDNVLYEVSNESDGESTHWQYHLINIIKSYEATLPKQHPVGMTGEYPGGWNPELFASSADWVSPNGDLNNPPVADGTKVILSDTDHLCGICGNREWVWKSFTRGENPIFMDGYDGAGYGVGGEGFNFNDPTWVSLRLNLGYTLAFANRINLAAMTPQNNLASTSYCLANPAATGAEYLVYAPPASGNTITVDLSATAAELSVAWFNPETGETVAGSTVSGGGNRSFPIPFAGDAVLYLYDYEQPHQPLTYLPVIHK